MELKIKKLDSNAFYPTRGSDKSSGIDLYSIEDIIIPPGSWKLVHTGIAFGIPEGYEIQVRPRSGVSLKTGLIVKNSPGTVDQDFLGEVSVNLANIGDSAVDIKRGDRIAQAVLCPVVIPTLLFTQDLGESGRGTNGWGSTGV